MQDQLIQVPVVGAMPLPTAVKRKWSAKENLAARVPTMEGLAMKLAAAEQRREVSRALAGCLDFFRMREPRAGRAGRGRPPALQLPPRDCFAP